MSTGRTSRRSQLFDPKKRTISSKCYCKSTTPMNHRRDGGSCLVDRRSDCENDAVGISNRKAAVPSRSLDDETASTKTRLPISPSSPPLSPETLRALESAEKLVKDAQRQIEEITSAPTGVSSRKSTISSPAVEDFEDDTDEKLYLRELVLSKFREVDAGGAKESQELEADVRRRQNRRARRAYLSDPRFKTLEERFGRVYHQKRCFKDPQRLCSSVQNEGSVADQQNTSRNKGEYGQNSPLSSLRIQKGPSVHIERELKTQVLEDVRISPDPSFVQSCANARTYQFRHGSQEARTSRSEEEFEKVEADAEESVAEVRESNAVRAEIDAIPIQRPEKTIEEKKGSDAHNGSQSNESKLLKNRKEEESPQERVVSLDSELNGRTKRVFIETDNESQEIEGESVLNESPLILCDLDEVNLYEPCIAELDAILSECDEMIEDVEHRSNEIIKFISQREVLGFNNSDNRSYNKKVTRGTFTASSDILGSPKRKESIAANNPSSISNSNEIENPGPVEFLEATIFESTSSLSPVRNDNLIREDRKIDDIDGGKLKELTSPKSNRINETGVLRRDFGTHVDLPILPGVQVIDCGTSYDYLYENASEKSIQCDMLCKDFHTCDKSINVPDIDVESSQENLHITNVDEKRSIDLDQEKGSKVQENEKYESTVSITVSKTSVKDKDAIPLDGGKQDIDVSNLAEVSATSSKEENNYTSSFEKSDLKSSSKINSVDRTAGLVEISKVPEDIPTKLNKDAQMAGTADKTSEASISRGKNASNISPRESRTSRKSGENVRFVRRQKSTSKLEESLKSNATNVSIRFSSSADSLRDCTSLCTSTSHVKPEEPQLKRSNAEEKNVSLKDTVKCVKEDKACMTQIAAESVEINSSDKVSKSSILPFGKENRVVPERRGNASRQSASSTETSEDSLHSEGELFVSDSGSYSLGEVKIVSKDDTECKSQEALLLMKNMMIALHDSTRISSSSESFGEVRQKSVDSAKSDTLRL